MARFPARLPTKSDKVLNPDNTYTDAQRRFLLEVEKATRTQLPNQPALSAGASLSDLLDSHNLLLANLKDIGAMEKD